MASVKTLSGPKKKKKEASFLTDSITVRTIVSSPLTEHVTNTTNREMVSSASLAPITVPSHFQSHS